MGEWSVYFDEGMAYYKTIKGARAKGRNFGNAVFYNLIGLSLESLLTALIMKEDDLPEHSSIGSMLRMLKDSYEVPESFKEETRFYNRFSNFCSLDAKALPDPNNDEISRMVNFLEEVKNWVVLYLGVTQNV